MKIEGLTVEELIERLRQCPPKAKVVGAAGDGTVIGIKEVTLGVVHRWYTGPACRLYNMSDLMHCPAHMVEQLGNTKTVEAVYIG